MHRRLYEEEVNTHDHGDHRVFQLLNIGPVTSLDQVTFHFHGNPGFEVEN
jgi:hypothetical protein